MTDYTDELVPSWIIRHMPFGKIHGHSTVTDCRPPDRRHYGAEAALARI
jgi:hypothetical protein